MLLVVAEKPGVAKDQAKVLGANQRGNGFYQGNSHFVTWAIGHLVNIADPDQQNQARAGRWNLSSLPMLPDQLALAISDKTKSQFEVISLLMAAPGILEIVAVTDAGREGELIFRRIYQMAACTKPFKRLWLSSMTGEAIRKAFSDLRPGFQYDNLAAAATARAEADWLTGMNFTRGMTVKSGDLISVGRVQSPVLAMLVLRRHEI